jgi:peptidoglycan/xylan/chitin deacetylase (PgdA/CDA1 family)
MKRILKGFIYWLSNWFLTKGAVVLMYHSVGEDNSFFTVKSSEFEKQIEYLKKNSFNVISLGQLEKYLKIKKIPPKTIVITFDDGYENNYTEAFPIIKKYKIPITIFLSTGKIGDKLNIHRGESLPMLDWQQISEMHDSELVDFEPHTINHPKLAKLNLEEITHEIRESKKTLESFLKITCPYFSYPFGSYNDESLRIVEDLGFRLAFTVKKGRVRVSTNRFLLPRNSIDSQVGFDEFKNIIRFGRI